MSVDPRDIFTDRSAAGRLAQLDRRLRALERVSWNGHQRYGATLAAPVTLTSSSYGLYQVFPLVPVYVPEGAWVSVAAGATFDIAHTTPPPTGLRNEGWAAIFETTDVGDPFFGGEQVFYTYHQGTATPPLYGTGPLNSNPLSILGDLAGAPMVYRPAVTGNKIYTLDFRRALGTVGAGNHVKVSAAWLTIEVR